MKEAVVYADSREGAMTESGDVILSGVSQSVIVLSNCRDKMTEVCVYVIVDLLFAG